MIKISFSSASRNGAPWSLADVAMRRVTVFLGVMVFLSVAALMVAVAPALIPVASAQEPPPTGWQVNPATGHFYKQVDSMTWLETETYAISHGGHLVTINDQAEQDWLAATFTQPNLWIGMNDRAVEGTWAWSSGEPVTYVNWVPGEPNDCTECYPGPNQGEDAAVMNWTDPFDMFGWNDLADFHTHSAIVEVAQEPPTPSFHVGLHFDGIGGEGWPAEVDVMVTADDPGTVEDPDIAMTLATNAEGGFGGDQVFPGLEPGWFITVTYGVTTKTHTVRNVSITDVDPATEIMRGTADPFTEVYASVHGEAAGYWLEADSSGEWLADFSGDYDITPGSLMRVLQIDEDGDHTFTDWQVPRPEGWQHNPVTGHDYLYVYDPMSWAEAEAFAVSLGGHLVTINDAAEDIWLVETLGTEYWIGFNDIAVEGDWVWVSGEPVTFTNWLPDEPNNSEPGEDAATIWNRPPIFGYDLSAIGWNDLPAGHHHPFVVEVGPITLDELLDDMVADGRLPNEGVASGIMKQAAKAPLRALTNHLNDLVHRGRITQQTMDQILVMVAG